MCFKRPSSASASSSLSSSSSSSSSPSSLRDKSSLFYIFLLFFTLCVITTFITPTSLPSPYIRNSNSGKLWNFYAKEEDKTVEIKKMRKTSGDRSKELKLRRILKGLGSSPPRCSSKCGRCKPCKPVHVPVPPGTPVTTEYYPEAWRCKCGNKLYMP